MIIKKKRINSLSCLSHVEDGKNLVMALCDAMRFKDVLLKLGFSEDLAEGERILPSMLNPTMKRNAEPFYIKDKTKPKEQYSQTLWWTRHAVSYTHLDVYKRQQEESRNISENIRWGVVRKFEKGKVIVNCTKFMGYTKNEDGDLVIVPEEAEIVKLIFRLYLEGYSTGKIAKHLEEQGIKTATGQDKWHSTVIDKMLRNEKYMGDALLQKTYTVDFMTKKKVKNTGLVPQYYVAVSYTHLF